MAFVVGESRVAVALALVSEGLHRGIAEWRIGVGRRCRSDDAKSHETWQCIVLEQHVAVYRHTVVDAQELKPYRDIGLVEADRGGSHELPSRSSVAVWATQCHHGGGGIVVAHWTGGW